jgi:hypothetical protein
MSLPARRPLTGSIILRTPLAIGFQWRDPAWRRQTESAADFADAHYVVNPWRTRPPAMTPGTAAEVWSAKIYSNGWKKPGLGTVARCKERGRRSILRGQRRLPQRECFKERFNSMPPSFLRLAHTAMLSKPKDVADVILVAAASVKQNETTHVRWRVGRLRSALPC